MMYGQLCTEFYDADKQFASAYELELYRGIFSQNDHILEPMCGSGRLLIPLLQLGYQVDGLDCSNHMLASCQKRAEALNLTPKLYQASIESFLPQQLYQGIIIPLGSFQLIYPRENACRALEKFNTILAEGGKLVMDLFIPWEALYEGGENDYSNREVTLETGDVIKITSHTAVNKFEQHMVSKSHYAKYSQGNCSLEEDEQMDILWYYPYEIELILNKYGFELIQCIPRVLNGSDHITIVAQSTKKK